MTKFLKMLVLAAAVVALSSVASATALCSAEIGVALSSLPTCEIDLTIGSVQYDLVFSSFAEAGGSSNATLATVDASTVGGYGGLEFGGSTGSTLSVTSLSYTVTLLNAGGNVATNCTGLLGAYTCAIDGQSQQANFGLLGNTNGQVSFTSDACGIPPTLAPGAQSYGPALCSSNVAAGTGLGLGISVNLSLPGPGSPNTLNYVDSDFYVTSSYNAVTPEPTTFVLLGAGLGLVGMLRRRSRAARQ